MALGKTNRIEGKAYSLKLKLKDGDDFLDVGYFDVQTKTADGYKSLKGEALAEVTGSEEPLRDVAGDLISLETRVGEHEGNPIRSFKFGLRDSKKNEVYFVDVGLGSNLGKGLANSLLNLKGLNNVQVGLYGQTNKETKKTYPAVALRQGEATETVKWKFDPKAEGAKYPAPREYPGKIDPKTKKPRTERDWTETEEFLIGELNDFAKFVEANKSKTTPAPAGNEPSDTASNPAPAQGRIPDPF